MSERKKPSSSQKLILNILLFAVTAFTLYQVYALSLLSDGKIATVRGGDHRDAMVEKNVVQVNVLNGCGVGGVGQRMTGYLRSVGYDVVDMGNYKTFDLKQSLVIDRSGNGEVAKKIASDLGIDPKNVVQHISIGKDFRNLRAWK
jgi:hypothetical protein